MLKSLSLGALLLGAALPVAAVDTLSREAPVPASCAVAYKAQRQRLSGQAIQS